MKLLREKLGITEHFYPFAERINPILYSFISSLPNDPNHPPNVSGKMTDRHLKHKELDTLIGWIYQMLSMDFGKRDGHWNFPSNMTCEELWAVSYRKGDYITPHSHSPFLYTFSYFVKVPKGSPPTVFPTSGHKAKAEEGKLVLFESRLVHQVPKSKVNDRCVIAGNFK